MYTAVSRFARFTRLAYYSPHEIVISVLQPKCLFYEPATTCYNIYVKKSYYTLTTQLLPGWHLPHGGHGIKDGQLEIALGPRLADVGTWTDPPHVALANLGYNPNLGGGLADQKAMAAFIKRYGALGVSPEEVGEAGDPVWLSLETFHLTQERLRAAWRKRDHRLFVDPDRLKGATGYEHVLRLNWEMRDGELVMRLASWYDYVAILLARDVAERRARVCGNPNCVAPFFVANRTDTMYCSHPCAVVVNVHRFRRRQQRRRRK